MLNAPFKNHMEDLAQIGSLSEELQDLSEEFLKVAPEEVQEILMEHLKRWGSTDILQEALKEGDVAPDFILPDQDGNTATWLTPWIFVPKAQLWWSFSEGIGVHTIMPLYEWYESTIHTSRLEAQQWLPSLRNLLNNPR